MRAAGTGLPIPMLACCPRASADVSRFPLTGTACLKVRRCILAFASDYICCPYLMVPLTFDDRSVRRWPLMAMSTDVGVL